MLALWIVLGAAGLVLLWAIVTFNRLVALRNRIEGAWSQIDVQLRRRHDLIPNLIETVKGYASHERSLFEEIARARSAGIEASSVADQAQAENTLTAGLRRLLAVAEAYPDLKANQNFLGLQEELTGTEGRIAYARQFYNDEVLAYNTKVQQFPSSIVATLARFGLREFFKTEDATRAPVQVDI
ncbi:MAG: LemA family protein [Actinomycetota bacterium]